MTTSKRFIQISNEELESLKKKMEALPPKEKPSNGMREKSEVLAELAPYIKQMVQRGYRMKDIAAWLKDQSIAVSTVTLAKATKTQARSRRSPKQEQKHQAKNDIKQGTKIEIKTERKTPMPFEKIEEV